MVSQLHTFLLAISHVYECIYNRGKIKGVSKFYSAREGTQVNMA